MYKGKSGAYPEDCGGTYGYEEYCPSDNERFYSYLKFFSLEDLIKTRESIFEKVKQYTDGSVRIFDTKRKKSRIRSMCSIWIKFKT